LLTHAVQDVKLELSVRYVAALVLKNTLRNHISALALSDELMTVKRQLLELLARLPSMNRVQEYPRKLIKEVIFITTKVVVQEFLTNQITSFFDALILQYS